MRRRVIGALRWLALAPALLALAPVAAQAADLRQGPDVTIPAGTTVADDVYAGAGRVTMAGTIAGSLIAAGGTVDVTGTVERDVMVTGGTVTISGPVMGSVRAAGGTLTVSGPVAQDVVLAGGTLDLGPEATIGRDLVLAGGTATVAGRVARDLTAGVGTLDLRGRVDRNVRAEVGNLHLESGAAVGGNLDYASDNTATIDSGATVSGVVTHSPANFARQPTPAERAFGVFVGWIRLVVGLFALGLILVLLFGVFSRRASEAIGRSPLASLGIGLAVLIGVPIAALIVFIVGLLVGGWPLSLAALALLGIAAAVGYVLSALFLGRNGFRLLARTEAHPLLALLVGLVVLTAVGLIPILGGLIGLAAVVFGLGALTLTLVRTWQGSPPAAVGAQGAAPVAGAPRA
ncbi:MAG TPA: hypothetical protein VLW53_01125 [Candidatus Eisenbacteria bacterium]|nr:hypothetical protein [Candidatus Eisenbacteria bacterium]